RPSTSSPPNRFPAPPIGRISTLGLEHSNFGHSRSTAPAPLEGGSTGASASASNPAPAGALRGGPRHPAGARSRDPLCLLGAHPSGDGAGVPGSGLPPGGPHPPPPPPRPLPDGPTGGGGRRPRGELVPPRGPAGPPLPGGAGVPGTGRPLYPHQPLQPGGDRSEEHTSELQSRENLVCRLLLEKKKEQN